MKKVHKTKKKFRNDHEKSLNSKKPSNITDQSVPVSQNTIIKRLINQKIPVSKTNFKYSPGFTIEYYKQEKPSEKISGKSDLSNTDTEYFYDNYQELMNPFLNSTHEELKSLTPDVLVNNDLRSISEIHKNQSDSCSHRASYQPYGRFSKQSKTHYRDLLPQTKAKLETFKPRVLVKLFVDGTQTLPEIRKNFRF